MIKILIILANQASGLFYERFRKKEYTFTIWFFSMQSHINEETSRKSFDIKYNNSEGMQNITKKWKEPNF